jgi:hypothetical protein
LRWQEQEFPLAIELCILRRLPVLRFLEDALQDVIGELERGETAARGIGKTSRPLRKLRVKMP